MGTFVVLLRGINVGGHNKLPMADLRAALTTDGLADVRTYIQSGNVVLTAPAADAEVVGAQVRSVIATDFGLDIPAIALTADELAGSSHAEPVPRRARPAARARHRPAARSRRGASSTRRPSARPPPPPRAPATR